jgi:hypothetical protein
VLSQDSQGFSGVTGYKHPFAIGHQVPNEIRNGMALACAGRALHLNSTMTLQRSRNGYLLGIRWLAKQYIWRLTPGRMRLRLSVGLLRGLNAHQPD